MGHGIQMMQIKEIGRYAAASLLALCCALSVGSSSAQEVSAPQPLIPADETVPSPALPSQSLIGPVRIDEAGKAGEVLVPLNKSQVLQLDRTFAGVSVGNAEVADVVPLSTRSLYVFGKQLGSTSVTVTDARGRTIAVVDVVVSYDLGGLKAQLFELVPGETIEVRAASDGSFSVVVCRAPRGCSAPWPWRHVTRRTRSPT